jgi:RimJ/RimL family protein N-acetyltransferase
MTIETSRLRLRPLTDADIEPWVSMFMDPGVMQYVTPALPSRDTAEAAFRHYRELFATKGYGWWAAETKDRASFVGAILLQDVEFTAAFTPAVEVGWMLPRDQWGNGYATEGARAALDHAFTVMKLDEVVALTTVPNVASQRVMQRLGMTHDAAEDFNHPQMSDAAWRCVVYRMRRSPAVGGTPGG